MNRCKSLAINALQRMKGHDLARARQAFSSYTSDEMNSQYGKSGKTCNEILNEYIDFDKKVDEAIEWVKKAGH